MESQVVDDSIEWIRIGAAAPGWNERQNGSLWNEGLIPTAGRTKGGMDDEELHLIQWRPRATAHHHWQLPNAKRQGACHCEQLKQCMREQQQAIHARCCSAEQQELSETMEGWVNCGGRLDAKLM